jgi:pimeloyl-ACP methyl ester carboxylesterase
MLQSFSSMSSQSKSFSFARTGKLLLAVALAAYMGLCTFMAVAQRSFLYFPRAANAAAVDQAAQSAGLQRWTNSSGANIGFKRPAPRQPAQGSVMIMYGNASTATGSARYADDLQQVAALDVYILEYPGYEDRPGKPTEKTLFAAASDGLQMIPTNKPVYLIGESLGSGVASYLAGTYPNQIAGLVLISPFTSITDVAKYHYPVLPVSLFVLDQFHSDRYLLNYHGKVGITVDGQDNVVPEKFGLRLYNGYHGPKKLWQFPNGSHTEIGEPETVFWKEAIDFWQNP